MIGSFLFLMRRLILILLVSIAIIYPLDFEQKDQMLSKAHHNSIPLSTFVKIEIFGITNITDCNDVEDCKVGKEVDALSTGSGVIIRKDQILTAGHICIKLIEADIIGDISELFDLNNDNQPVGTSYGSMYAVDFTGEKHPLTLISMSTDADVCILQADTLSIKPVVISDKMPPIGEKIYNVSAPAGIFSPGMFPVFDGYYAGIDSDGDGTFTIPAWGGSSGSPVFNNDGELIGMIYATYTSLGHMSIGLTVDEIKEFISSNDFDL